MHISAETLRIQLEYTEWATNRLLEAAAKLSPEQLARDFGTADKSVLGTLTHVFAADRVWLARIEGTPQERPEGYDLPRLGREWGALYARWKSWATALTPPAVEEKLSYKDLKGNPWVSPIWQIVLHVVNHGTHHRGQVAGFLRSMGQVPPPLDLIAYYRTL
ncbi:MAG: DinB family protein [Thermoanaerobaculia bacterium]